MGDERRVCNHAHSLITVFTDLLEHPRLKADLKTDQLLYMQRYPPGAEIQAGRIGLASSR